MEHSTSPTIDEQVNALAGVGISQPTDSTETLLYRLEMIAYHIRMNPFDHRVTEALIRRLHSTYNQLSSHLI